MRNTFAILISALILTGSALNLKAQCKAKQVVKECKPSVAPYIYDSYAMNELVFDPAKTTVVEVEFTAFAGQKYKLVFCTAGLDQPIKLNIYDKNQRFKKRNKIYDSENGIEGKWSFEPSKSGTYYIDYEIPASSTKMKKTGCVVMLIGYND